MMAEKEIQPELPGPLFMTFPMGFESRLLEVVQHVVKLNIAVKRLPVPKEPQPSPTLAPALL